MDRLRLLPALHDLRQLHEQLLAATRQAQSLADQSQQALEHVLERWSLFNQEDQAS